MVVGGKDTNIYLLDRDNLGKFNASTNNIYQEIPGVLGSGAVSSPAFFYNSISAGGVNTPFQRFQFDFSNPNQPLLGATPAAQTSETFQYPGCTPSISSNGNTNGIVWAYEYNTSHAVLHAFDPLTLSELYNRWHLARSGDKICRSNCVLRKGLGGYIEFARGFRALSRGRGFRNYPSAPIPVTEVVHELSTPGFE
jgi:hypothetical protein